MKLSDTEQRDLRLTCLHEFAHLHVARHFGVVGFVSIERNPDGGLYETHWCGRFEPLNAAPSRHAAAVIGLAGAVAEWLDFEWHTSPSMVLDDLVEQPEHLSATDRAKVGAVTLPKVKAAMRHVRHLWPGIKAAAAHAQELASHKLTIDKEDALHLVQPLLDSADEAWFEALGLRLDIATEVRGVEVREGGPR